ncbi:mediator of RNA polymerase II transcription subunit 6 isoform X2 [Macadamia integrifolia]|uniref:mediator of RNA polymerase II transcription subunit 6 isoform X2 n=1 Tax=Macadamia integrifolia TaxID=60698 RepID=UPI001C4E9ED8|nr:mediator of RNA polymerase II transcription subunit 6 isoform X2 [Macadamia integrifolia]
MAATPLIPQNPMPGNPNLDGNQQPPPPPGTDMTGICFRDQLWLNTYPLDRNLVFDYFALSPFYDWSCNNEQLRMRAIHPLDIPNLSKMTGTEYMLSEVMEPHLFVIRKQKRDSPEKVTPMLTYYVLDGSIYQAPQLCNVFAARIGRALYHISKAFTTAASKLEKIGYVDAENEGSAIEPKVGKEIIDFKEVKRVDHILAALQRKNFCVTDHSDGLVFDPTPPCGVKPRRIFILQVFFSFPSFLSMNTATTAETHSSSLQRITGCHHFHLLPCPQW